MRTVIAMLLSCLLLFVVPSAHASPVHLTQPVPGAPVELFDEGLTRYSAGHRGVDLGASPGEQVHASAGGTVHFAGVVAGRPSVSVDHGGGVRTTYTPVLAIVSRGQVVLEGQVIGAVGTDDHCRPQCLHWGLTDGMDYYDPLFHMSAPVIRLLPQGSSPQPRPHGASVAMGGSMPVQGRNTSGFGMRRHPITGILKLHDGTDIAAACGTPVAAPWPGKVAGAAFHSAYGYRVVVDHGGIRTAYAHLRGLEVRVGDELGSGARLGAVGSTGLSTGCHLHWMAWRNGALIDPLTLTG